MSRTCNCVHVLAVASLIGELAVPALANVFNMGSGLTSLDTVRVGDAGNAADTRYATFGYGAVAYAYNIGKYEVTAGQYTQFLNAVAKTDTYRLYNSAMQSDVVRGCKIQRNGDSGSYTYSISAEYANLPVNYVSFWDACRFANWLHNGQPSGAQNTSTTEDGAYSLYGYNSYGGWEIQRNTNWKWAVTNEEEWYKAAYYMGGSVNAGYWNYPTRSNSINSTMANYTAASIGHTTNVGSYPYSSPYGTYDQGGNLWEWTEQNIPSGYPYPYVYSRVMRGGSFTDYQLHASMNGSSEPSVEMYYYGFRIVEVPEPASLALLAIGGLVAMRRVRS